MKSTKVLSLLLLTFGLQCFFAQNLDVYYKATFKPDKEDKSYIEEDDFLLSIRRNQSIYYSAKYFFAMTNQEAAMKQNIDISRLSSNYIITKEGDKVKHHQVILGPPFVYYEEKELPKWKLHNEYKEIDSMKCQKATTHFRGRDYTAWYSQEVAVAEGPYKFKNLPGLVIELSSDDGDYHYSLNMLKKNDEEIDLVESVALNDRNHYLKELKKVADNPSYKMQQADQARGMDQKDYIDGKEVNKNEKYKLFNEFVWNFMKKHDNPIETDDIWIR